jgi:cyanate lyase
VSDVSGRQEFGDGLMLEIDFDTGMESRPDPKADCVKITMWGKFPPLKARAGNE